jgi:EAL domain-containing protein (putative c-di-GMP-specific phosphodiesterase class I)
MTVHVNISARQATDPALTERILRALHRHSLPTSALVIELGEVALTSQLDDPNDTLRRLRDAGIGLAFDDFGTGSSSLSLLRRFPVTQLKLDGTFVSELASDPAGVAVTRSIVELAHALGMVVVAESLVNADDLAALRRLGCDRAQGYLLGDPAEAALVGARLDADMS